MSIRKVTCLDGTSYRIGENLSTGQVKEISVYFLAGQKVEFLVKTTHNTIHIPYHAVLLYIEE